MSAGEGFELRDRDDGARESRRHEMAGQLKGTIERRQFQAGELELREQSDGAIRMGGYASVTGVDYEIGDPARSGFVEVIKRGAFRRTLSESPAVSLLYGHEGMPYASTRNQSLVLEEDTRGLHWIANLDREDPDSRVLARKVQQGLITECSFAFLVTDEAWSSDFKRREIKSVSLNRGDVSLVVAGANPETSVSLRAKSRIALPDHTTRARAELDLLVRRMGYRSYAEWQRANPPRSFYLEERLWLERKRTEARLRDARAR